MAEGRMGRGARILLYVSLFVNLLVVGLVVGALVVGGPRGQDKRPAVAGEAGLGPLMRAMEPADRRALGRQMRANLRDNRLSRGEMRVLMAEIQEALREVPFDAAAVDTRLEAQMGEVAYRLDLARALFIERLTQMSDAERAAYAGRLADEMEKSRRFPRREGPGN